MMNQKEKMTKDFLEELDDYYMQLVYLKDLLNVEKDMDKHNEKLQYAPNFTLIVKCALEDSYMLSLMKLYDKSAKAKTIQNLIKKAKSNIHIFPSSNETLDKLNEFETKIDQDEFFSHAIKALTDIRDTIHVHNDKKYFGKNLAKDDSYFKMYHIWFLVNFAEEVLNYLFSQLSSEESRKTKYNNDISNLFLKS